LTRASVAIQFTPQVVPPSSENACSEQHEFGVSTTMNKESKAGEAEIRAIINEWADEQREKNAVSLSSAMTVNCFPSLPISA